VFNLIDFNRSSRSIQNYPLNLISSATFNLHSQSQIFLYTQSNGNINICDFREKSDFSYRPSILLSTSTENLSTVYANWLNYVS